MHKTFTSTKSKLKNEKEIEPSKQSVDFILNYSKALKIKKSSTIDQIVMNLN